MASEAEARDRDTFVALDIGTSKVCALIVGRDGFGGCRVLGAGVSPSAGVRKGVVVGVEEVVQAVTAALRRAERAARCRVARAVVNLAGAHVASLNSRGVAALGEAASAVEPEDVARAVESARAVLLPASHELIHTLPRGFTVDGRGGIQNPRGMVGRRLEVEVHLVTAEATPIRNLEQCLRRAGVAPSEFVAQGLAAAEAVLSPEEKELGVAVVDVGAGTTDLAVFADGAPWHTAVLPVGGNNVTRDIAVGLRVPLDVAEDLKLSFACADGATAAPGEMLSARSFGGEIIEVPRRELCDIVAARVDETLALLRAELERLGGMAPLPAGFVLTGGAVELDGFAERAAELLDAPVRIGRPGLPGALGGRYESPAFAAVAGLARWGRWQAQRSDDAASRRRHVLAAGGAAVATLSPVAQRFAGWLRAFLP